MEMTALSNHRVSLPQLSQSLVLLFALSFIAEPVGAQQAPFPPADASQPSRIDAAALVLRNSDPRLKGASQEYVRGLAEFVTGNLLFVLLHEMAHASITQMGLPVLGK